MRTILKCWIESENLTYIKFQPGDGTMYNAFLTDYDSDNIFVAIGVEPHINGGYLMRKDSLINLKDMLAKWCFEQGPRPRNKEGSIRYKLQNYHYTSYMLSHMPGCYPWTVVVAILLGMIYVYSAIVPGDALKLIGHIDRNESAKAWDILGRLSIEPE